MSRTTPTPPQQWWSAEELAAAGLPDLPSTRQGVEALIKRGGWRQDAAQARRRAGRGGGWEYSWKLLPVRARHQLTRPELATKEPERMGRDEAWAWFDAAPEAVKAKARVRQGIVQKVEVLEPAIGRRSAVTEVARLEGLGARTVWSWLALVAGVRADDRLPYLAPRHQAAPKRPRAKDCDPAFFALIKSDYLRLEQPSFTACYRRARRVALAEGWDIMPERTMRRRLDASVSQVSQVLARKGLDAVKRMYPAQVRDKTALVALEAVNADFHKFDVFVRWPAARGEKPVIGRAQMVAFQDIYSGRILAWRVDQTPNATAVLLCAGDMIEAWGIPQHVLLDNGREFAAKAITGGSPTRYRFKVRDEDIPGLFTSLGCDIHWATPYAGQSKPIERAFRDMCDAIAKDPRFAGAWTGNRPEAKPENYGSRAIDLEQFLEVLAEGIEEHNTRQGRRSEVAWGRSFVEVFDESYATAPIRKATEAQRRLWLLGAEGLRAESNSGRIRFQGSEFWAAWMHEIAGQRVIIRFDPAGFFDGLHIYSQDNAYLGHAPCLVKAGFFDMAEARTHARHRNAWMAAEKAALAAHRKYKAAEIGEGLAALTPPDLPKPEAKVVRPVFAIPAPRAGRQVPAPDLDRAQAAIVADLASRRSAPAPVAEEEPRERFRRALQLERAQAAGGTLTAEQQRWLSVYQTQPEYRAERMLWDEQGDTIFG